MRAAEASILLARKGWFPDFNLGAMVDLKTDPTLYRFPGNPGTMTFPIWRDKIAAQIAEAQANKRSAEARLPSGRWWAGSADSTGQQSRRRVTPGGLPG